MSTAATSPVAASNGTAAAESQMDSAVNGGWSQRLRATAESLECHNYIRELVHAKHYATNKDKEVIRLSLGDPAAYGNLPAPSVALEALSDAVLSGKNNIYMPTTGSDVAKEAVAKKHNCPGNPITKEDVVMTSGCGQAIEFALTAMCEPGSEILLSKPGYPLYRTVCESKGITFTLYNLLPDRSWEVDIDDLESKINDKTRLLALVNPSNPCGSAYSRQHLLDIIDIARRHHLPVFADEVYAGVVYNGGEFHPLASVANDVPIIMCSSLTKRYHVPGWRTGWMVFYDQHHRLDEVRTGVHRLSSRVGGPCSLIYPALPRIFEDTPDEFFEKTKAHLTNTSKLMFDRLSQVPCLKPIKPCGAMYMLVGISMEQLSGVENDMDFITQLMAEESLFLLPGTAFFYPGYVRIVLTSPVGVMEEAAERIVSFCERHAVPQE